MLFYMVLFSLQTALCRKSFKCYNSSLLFALLSITIESTSFGYSLALKEVVGNRGVSTLVHTPPQIFFLLVNGNN